MPASSQEVILTRLHASQASTFTSHNPPIWHQIIAHNVLGIAKSLITNDSLMRITLSMLSNVYYYKEKAATPFYRA